jgi:hypothetical protein
MRKLRLSFLLFFVFVSVIHSIDTDKARKAIEEYSYINQYSHTSLLVDYGFTEKQIKAWTVTGTYIGWYPAIIPSIKRLW